MKRDTAGGKNAYTAFTLIPVCSLVSEAARITCKATRGSKRPQVVQRVENRTSENTSLEGHNFGFPSRLISTRDCLS